MSPVFYILHSEIFLPHHDSPYNYIFMNEINWCQSLFKIEAPRSQGLSLILTYPEALLTICWVTKAPRVWTCLTVHAYFPIISINFIRENIGQRSRKQTQALFQTSLPSFHRWKEAKPQVTCLSVWNINFPLAMQKQHTLLNEMLFY